MAGLVPKRAGFTFVTRAGISFSARVTSVAFEAAQAAVVDMTGTASPLGEQVLVPTGEWASPGTITVDFIYEGSPFFDAGQVDYTDSLVRKPGSVTFTSTAYTITRNVICDSVAITATTGDIVRGTLKFILTDYLGL